MLVVAVAGWLCNDAKKSWPGLFCCKKNIFKIEGQTVLEQETIRKKGYQDMRSVGVVSMKIVEVMNEDFGHFSVSTISLLFHPLTRKSMAELLLSTSCIIVNNE